jgi:hypothetical protein
MVRTSVQAPCAHISPPIRGSEAATVGERRWFRLPLPAVGLIAALVAAVTAPATAGATTPLPRPFAANGFWNAPLPTATAVDPRSPELVGDLVRQAQTWVPWINTTNYSAPIYVVGAGQPGQWVQLDHGGWWAGNHQDALTLQQQLASVPIPGGARPAGGTDREMVVWQPSSDTMWELLGARHVPQDTDPWSVAPGWHAEWAARIDHVSESSGVLTYPFGASSSGLALAGGMISAGELEQGHIDHALALGIPQVRASIPVAPATRTDGRYAGANAISEGQRFRLDPTLDIPSLHLPAVAQALAVAAQRYGIVVRDVSGAISFYAQDPRSLGSNPYPALFGGVSPDKLLARFPWDRLQAVGISPSGVPAAAPQAPPSIAPGTPNASRPKQPTARKHVTRKKHHKRSHKRKHRPSRNRR